MASLKTVLKTAERFVVSNSPAIMTGIGVAGVVATAVLTGKASYSAALRIASENEVSIVDGKGALTDREKLDLVGKEFIPPAVVGVITMAAIIGANRIGTRRAAALAAAFKISEKMADEYRQKVIEAVGAKGEEELRAKLAKDRIDRTPGSDTVIITGNNSLFFDEFSGQYFESSMQAVQNAVNQINHQINQTFYASLTEFYDLLGLNKSDMSDEFGWNSDELLDIYHTAVMTNDGKAAVAIRYNTTPFKHYNKVR